jgi:hypothetical protein
MSFRFKFGETNDSVIIIFNRSKDYLNTLHEHEKMPMGPILKEKYILKRAIQEKNIRKKEQ